MPAADICAHLEFTMTAIMLVGDSQLTSEGGARCLYTRMELAVHEDDDSLPVHNLPSDPQQCISGQKCNSGIASKVGSYAS